mmetsp:Transcript_26176/g.69706  ORF Transcript_26176/g.69706 Transcript_26176/m.69706 type:complete len:174 (+) Transcript_26176:584-1105(+)
MVADVLEVEVEVATEATLSAATSRVWLDIAAAGMFNDGNVGSGGAGAVFRVGGDAGELPPSLPTAPPPSAPIVPPAPAAAGSGAGTDEGLNGGDPSSIGDGDGVGGGDGACEGEVDGGDGDGSAGRNGGEPLLLPLPRSPPASSPPAAPAPAGPEELATFATITSEASLPKRV